jgi:radical SAM superfamily enzyme YgiQ (UPF0313 family)
MAQLAIETKNLNFTLEQIQDFTPTPMTLATVMYYSGLNPYNLKKVFVARSRQEKENQRQYFFWYQPRKRKQLIKRMQKAGWHDLAKRLLEPKANDNSRKGRNTKQCK